jgi:hypothetical protein
LEMGGTLHNIAWADNPFAITECDYYCSNLLFETHKVPHTAAYSAAANDDHDVNKNTKYTLQLYPRRTATHTETP